MSGYRTCVGRLALFVAATLVALPATAADVAEKKPVALIFDTDMGNDIDDAMALAMIHALESRGECKLLAVTLSKDNDHSAPCVDLLNTFYGRGDVPIGVVRRGVTPADGKYIRQVVTAGDAQGPYYPHDLKSGRDAPEAVALLRKTLAGRPDKSVVVVMVGFSTNMARLLDSAADEASPLPGRELVRRKVRLLSTMAGSFSPDLAAKRYKEYNIIKDLPSARRVLADWPTPIVLSGYEIGRAISYPGRSIRDDYRYVARHPLRHGYQLYRGEENDQPTYDLTSVLYAVRPDRGYFSLSPPGRVVCEEDGHTHFRAEPNGPHRYLLADAGQMIRVREALVMLSSQPPDARRE